MTVLYFDCFSGASGDMILGALLDAGAPLDRVRSSLEALDIEGWELSVDHVHRGHLRATRAEVVVAGAARTTRTLRDVIDIIDRASLTEPIRRRARCCFNILAEAEGRVHGVEPEDVHFHDVGSLDAIIDVVACSTAFEHFGTDHVVTSAIATGTGTIDGPHGTLPLPAPAVVEILQSRGATMFGRGHTELVTPTGAALLATFSDDFGDLPSMTLEGSGYGAGHHDLATPNVLRVLVGRSVDAPRARSRSLVIETNVDDMSPELVPHLIDRLLEAGAHDAWVTPIVMKKGRPALTVSVLAASEAREQLAHIIYREATTLGLRLSHIDRDVLERRWVDVVVEDHPVRVKLGIHDGEIVNSSPEYDDARAVAYATGLPLKKVYALAIAAAASSAQP
ncbi:nickel pincer cofactor biosynthesis protein LarC [soil metagenome]